jgi:hypothetical protein
MTVTFPIPAAGERASEAAKVTARLTTERDQRQVVTTNIVDWLHHKFDLEKPSAVLSKPQGLDADALPLLFARRYRAAASSRLQISSG